jgi:transcriptional regulator with XRE-family HTH domain
MEYNIKELAERVKGLRGDFEYTQEYVAEKCGISLENYKKMEDGEKDFSITDVNILAKFYKIDFIELLTGDTPKLKNYSIVRNGKGLPVQRREGFDYLDSAYLFSNKKILPVIVTAPYDKDAENKPISLSSHEGQEYDLVISGKLKITIGGHIEILNEGDAIYYDSSTPHGMIALDGECKFLAVLV